MTETLREFSRLRRPRILIRAARIGVPHYSRKTHLPRHLGYGSLPHSQPALEHLMQIEAGLNEQRREKTTSYSISRHVDVLIAMMGEARILRTSLGSSGA